MWDAFLKLEYQGKWWKICVVCRVAKILRLKEVLYSGGMLGASDHLPRP